MTFLNVPGPCGLVMMRRLELNPLHLLHAIMAVSYTMVVLDVIDIMVAPRIIDVPDIMVAPRIMGVPDIMVAPRIIGVPADMAAPNILAAPAFTSVTDIMNAVQTIVSFIFELFLLCLSVLSMAIAVLYVLLIKKRIYIS